MYPSFKQAVFCLTALLVVMSKTISAAYTWETCKGGPTKELCTDVFSTHCCSLGTFSKARCCSPTSCNYAAPIYGIRKCPQFTQSRCCPSTSGRMVGSSCCNGAEYSYTLSSSSRSSSFRSVSYSKSISRYRSSVSSEQSYYSSILAERRSRSSQSSSLKSWRSYTSRVNSSLLEALGTAQRAQQGAIAAGVILGILIVVLIVVCIIAARSSANKEGDEVTRIRYDDHSQPNPGFVGPPPVATQPPTFPAGDQPPPSYDEVHVESTS